MSLDFGDAVFAHSIPNEPWVLASTISNERGLTTLHNNEEGWELTFRPIFTRLYLNNEKKYFYRFFLKKYVSNFKFMIFLYYNIKFIFLCFNIYVVYIFLIALYMFELFLYCYDLRRFYNVRIWFLMFYELKFNVFKISF